MKYSQIALFCVFGLLLFACDNLVDITKPPEEAEEAEKGTLSMVIMRKAVVAETDTIPSQVEKLTCRVWHESAGVNQVETVNVPAPGDSVRLEIRLVAREGYSVGLIAYYQMLPPHSDLRIALVGGKADSVTVYSDSTTLVDLDLEQWEIEADIPDTLKGGEKSPFSVRVTKGPVSDFLWYAQLFGGWAQGETMVDSVVTIAETPGPPFLYGRTASGTFFVPAVESNRNIYFQFRLWFLCGDKGWSGAGTPFLTLAPSLVLGDSLITRPVLPAVGTIIIII